MPTGRWCGGTKRRSSCQVSPLTTRRPRCGRERPARQRSIVLLPDPDGPNRAVTPWIGSVICVSSSKPGKFSLKSASIISGRLLPRRVEGVEQEQDDEGKDQ